MLKNRELGSTGPGLVFKQEGIFHAFEAGICFTFQINKKWQRKASIKFR